MAQKENNSGTQEILERHRRAAFIWCNGFFITVCCGIAVAKFLQTGSIVNAALRVAIYFGIQPFIYYFLRIRGTPKAAYRILVYGCCAGIVVIRFLSAPAVMGQMLDLPVIAIAAAFFIGGKESVQLTIGTYLMLLIGYVFSAYTHIFPTLFLDEPKATLFVGPTLTLFGFYFIWKLVVSLNAEVEKKQDLVELHLKNYRNLFAMLTHDLANLLSISSSYIEREKFDQANAALNRSISLIRSIRQIQLTGETGNDKLERVSVNGKEIIETCELVFRALKKTGELNLIIKNELPSDVTLMTSGPIFNHSIVHNFMSNAVKFSPKGGDVTVHLYLANERIILDIIDQGPGVPPEVLDSLRAKIKVPSRLGNNGDQGQGLGLRNAFEMADKLGYPIEILSHPPQGTIIRIIYGASFTSGSSGSGSCHRSDKAAA